MLNESLIVTISLYNKNFGPDVKVLRIMQNAYRWRGNLWVTCSSVFLAAAAEVLGALHFQLVQRHEKHLFLLWGYMCTQESA